jgi:NitT/TauT family transport system substrate-binding protein
MAAEAGSLHDPWEEIAMQIKRLLGTAVLLWSVAGTGLQAEPFRLIVTHLEPPLVPNSVMDLAVELGYFEREGVEVELIRVQQTPLAVAALLAGEGEMANVGVDALVQLTIQQGPLLKAVSSPNKALPFLIAAKEDITTIADLAGRSFGVGRIGSLDHSLSTKVIEAGGVDTASLDFVTLGQPNVRAQALAAGQIDATTMSIGTWMAIPDTTGLHVLVPQEAYYAAAPVVNKVNAVPPAVLAERRDEVAAVTRALIRISRDFAADPDAWAKAMVPHAGTLSETELVQLAHSFEDSWSVNGGMNRDEMAFTQEWLYETEDFKDAPAVELDAWTDFSILAEVLDEIGVDAGSDQPGL